MNNTLKKPTLQDEMRSKLRREGYAYSTENSYCDWVRRFVKFHAFKSREATLPTASIGRQAKISSLSEFIVTFIIKTA